MRITHPHAAGVDVHATVHVVCVPAQDAPPPPKEHAANVPANVRHFGTCTADLEMLADWLQACGVTTVAIESTGIYWVPLFELLERRGFEVYLVDPRQTKHVPGRPKATCLIANGFSVCTATVCWQRRFGRATRSWCCAAICGSGRC